MNSSNHYLFVYGSLLSGFNQPAFEYIRRYFTLVGPAKVKGELYDLGSYPAAVPSMDETYIIGELYQLNNNDEYSWAFSQLDDYEGIHAEDGKPTLYRREQVEVRLDERLYFSWVYWFNGDVTGQPLVTSGNVADYFRYKN